MDYKTNTPRSLPATPSPADLDALIARADRLVKVARARHAAARLIQLRRAAWGTP